MPTLRLTSVNQLIPDPDVFGIKEAITNWQEESDQVNAILADLPKDCVSVSMSERRCMVSSEIMMRLPHPQDDDTRVIPHLQLPCVRIRLYASRFRTKRIIAAAQEEIIARFLTNIGFTEIVVPPADPNDRTETRDFSITNQITILD